MSKLKVQIKSKAQMTKKNEEEWYDGTRVIFKILAICH
jgi:hypothetical protein